MLCLLLTAEDQVARRGSGLSDLTACASSPLPRSSCCSVVGRDPWITADGMSAVPADPQMNGDSKPLKKSSSKKNKKGASARQEAGEPPAAAAAAAPQQQPMAEESAPIANGSSTAHADAAVPAGAPDKFLCALSKTVMEDPVVVESGEVFERQKIEEWFAEGNTVCPATGQPVRPDVLISLPSVKREIVEWKQGGGGDDATPESAAELGEMLGQLAQITRTLSSHLQSAEKLSRVLSSRVAGGSSSTGAEPLREVSGQVHELANQVSQLSASTPAQSAGPSRSFFAAVADTLRHIAQATASAVGGAAAAVQERAGAVGGAVGYHVGHAASALGHHVGGAAALVKDRGGTAASAVQEHARPVVHAVAQRVGGAARVVRQRSAAVAGSVSGAAVAAAGVVQERASVVGQHVGHAGSHVAKGLGSAGRGLQVHAAAALHSVKGTADSAATMAKEQYSKAAEVVAAEWGKLPSEHKGIAKAAAVFVGLHLLARMVTAPGRRARKDADVPKAGFDLGKLVQQMVADVQKRLGGPGQGQGAADGAGRQGKGQKQAKGKSKGKAVEEGAPAGLAGMVESVQRTGLRHTPCCCYQCGLHAEKNCMVLSPVNLCYCVPPCVCACVCALYS